VVQVKVVDFAVSVKVAEVVEVEVVVDVVVAAGAAHRGAAAVIVEWMQFKLGRAGGFELSRTLKAHKRRRCTKRGRPKGSNYSGALSPLFCQPGMSALVRVTDLSQTSRHVRKVPMNEPALRERAARGAEPVAPME
jgi:hypothetical protein